MFCGDYSLALVFVFGQVSCVSHTKGAELWHRMELRARYMPYRTESKFRAAASLYVLENFGPEVSQEYEDYAYKQGYHRAKLSLRRRISST